MNSKVIKRGKNKLRQMALHKPQPSNEAIGNRLTWLPLTLSKKKPLKIRGKTTPKLLNQNNIDLIQFFWRFPPLFLWPFTRQIFIS